MENKGTCIVCGTQLRNKQTHFCSSACKNKHHQSYSAQKDRGLARKLALVKAAGGKCSICGYNKNLAALAFHHTDPNGKDFKLDMRSMSNRNLERVLSELGKCILVCHNCHSELHHPHLNLDSLLEPVALTAELWTPERQAGFEPATCCLEGNQSTPELLPQ